MVGWPSKMRPVEKNLHQSLPLAHFGWDHGLLCYAPLDLIDSLLLLLLLGTICGSSAV